MGCFVLFFPVSHWTEKKFFALDYSKLTCSILASLHKLPILFRINFKVLLIVFKPLNGQHPTYITDLLGYTPSPDPSGPQAKDFWMCPSLDSNRERTELLLLLLHHCGTIFIPWRQSPDLMSRALPCWCVSVSFNCYFIFYYFLPVQHFVQW